jgi:hypothetical protein
MTSEEMKRLKINSSKGAWLCFFPMGLILVEYLDVKNKGKIP